MSHNFNIDCSLISFFFEYFKSVFMFYIVKKKKLLQLKENL